MQERFLITIENIGEFLKKPHLRNRCVDIRACSLEDEKQGYLLTLSDITVDRLEKDGEDIKIRQDTEDGRLMVYPISSQDKDTYGERMFCKTYVLTPEQVNILELGYEEEHELMMLTPEAIYLLLGIGPN